jgi:hypothetical protein
MKKSVKKLALHRETLRSLQERSLMKVPGGVPTGPFQREPTGCDCYTNTCPPPDTGCFATCSCPLTAATC